MKRTRQWLSAALLCLILVLLPMTVEAAGVRASGNCGAEGDNIKWVLTDDGVLTITGTGAMADGSPWYSMKSVVTEVIIGDGVTRIGENAFIECWKLESIAIPESVTSIGEYAFLSCINLKYVAIPSGVTVIENSTFAICESLTSITIPEGVTTIGRCAFEDCKGLTSITIPDSVTTIETAAFSACSGLTSVVVPDNVTAIPDQMFWDCSNLKEVTLPQNVTTIGRCAFDECTSLENIMIPAGVKEIGDYVFNECPSLTDITVDSGNMYYSSRGGVLFNKQKTVLLRCPEGNSRTTYSIPETVREIYWDAFEGCTKLESVTIPEGVACLWENAFRDCSSLTSITLPSSVSYLDGNVFWGCTSLENITVDSGNTYFCSQDGVVFTKDKTALVIYPAGNSRTAYVIPDSVKVIREMAFAGCEKLKSITIPDSVTEIWSGAFNYCTSLASITVPGSVTTLGGAFIGCTGLKSVVLSPGVTTLTYTVFLECTGLESVTLPDTLTHIGYGVFQDCTSLKSIVIPESVTEIGTYAFEECTSLTSIAIPDGVTRIEADTFWGCVGLRSIAIPASVTSVGTFAFAYCDDLDTVYYGGTEAQWKAIEFERCKMPDLRQLVTKIVYNSSGEVVLAVPSLTVTKNSSGKPYLTWTAVDGATKYEIWYSAPALSWAKLITTSGTKLTHSSAVDGTMYYYKVRAINGESEGVFSSVVNIMVGDHFSAPMAAAKLNDAGKPYIWWSEVEGATKYEVWYTTDGDNYTKLITTTKRELTHSSAKAGKTYIYRIRGISDTINGDFCATNRVEVNHFLAAPTLTLTKNNNGKPYLTWTAVTDAAKYEVWYSTDGATFSKLIATTGKALTHSSAKAGRTYYYKVRAINSFVDGVYSNVKNITTAASLTAPALTVSKNASGKPYLSWTAVSGAAKYEVYFSTDGKTFTKLIDTTGKVLTHSSAKAGTTYYYKVRAINATANGTFSAVKSAVMSFAAPTLTVTKNSSGKPYLTWTGVTGATKYEVYSSTDGKTFTKLIATTGKVLTHSSAKAGTTYYYKVRAINATTNGTFSAVKSAVMPLAAPTLTVTKNSSGKPYLTWTGVTGATKYEVYSSTDGKTFTKLITTTGKVLTHSSAKAGTTYYYKVRAINTTTNGTFSAVKNMSVN